MTFTAREMRDTPVKFRTPEMHACTIRALQNMGAYVECAFNLHRDEYSIRYQGKVVAYAERVTLADVTFKVNERGRQRVIETGQKNLHAFVQGRMTLVDPEKYATVEYGDVATPVRYNPYESAEFRTLDDEPVKRARFMTLYLSEQKTYRTLAYNPRGD